MPNLPGVSFVVPVYNKARHLPAVLLQIERQTGDFTRQFVFVDDGSTDGSLEVLRRLTSNWSNTVIHTQSNKGSAGSTNACIALADQPFIKFVDADDLITNEATETLLRALYCTDACLAYGNAAWYRDEADIDLTRHVGNPRIQLISHPLRLAMKNSMFNPTQSLVRTESVKAVGGCDERVVHSQEYSMTLRLARRWPLMHVDAQVAFIPEEAERLSNNEACQLQRVTRALALFLEDYPDTEPQLKRFACRRAAGRAWHYARRKGGVGFKSPWFRQYIKGLFATGKDSVSFIEACCHAFELTEENI